MYKVIFQKAKDYCAYSFTTDKLDVESIERMVYWYYSVKVIKNNRVILDYTA